MATNTVVNEGDADRIIDKLVRFPVVKFQHPALICRTNQNDLVGLMEILLEKGFRRVTEADLSVGTILIELSFSEDLFGKGEKKGPNAIIVRRVKISEIHTPKDITRSRQQLTRRLEKGSPDAAISAKSLISKLGNDPLYVLEIDGKDPKTGKTNQKCGQLDQNHLIRGSSMFPVMKGQEPEILSSIFLIKIE